MMINIQAGWAGFALGCVAGAVIGLFFHDANWLGGYAAWPRRMLRLGHIALFGIGMLNLFFGLTARALGLTDGLTWISHLLLVAAVGMPTVCFLAAWKKPFRHLFFIPALAAMAGLIGFALRLVAG